VSPNIQFYPKAVRAGDCISDGLNIIQPNYFLYVGICLLALVLTACIPCFNYFLLGPVSVGVYYTILRQMRNESVEFGMMFNGFQKFVPAMVIGLIQALPQMVGDGIRFTNSFADGFSRGINRRSGTSNYFAQSIQGFPEIALSGGIIAIILVFALILILFALAWSITFSFALPLLAEHDLSIGDAITLSAKAGWANWTGLIVLSIFQFFIAVAGVLLLCVGIFFVMPIIYGSKMVAYRQVFPDNKMNYNNEPPRPDAYGGTYGMPQNFQ
jgi:hypothetical protein